MFEKHLLEEFFKHVASKNQLPGLSVSWTLVKNGLKRIPEILGLKRILGRWYLHEWYGEGVRISSILSDKNYMWLQFTKKRHSWNIGSTLFQTVRDICETDY